MFNSKSVLIILFSLIFATTALSQSYILTTEFGNFYSAKSFIITSSGMIYVTDTGKNEIIKLDTLGNELKRIGGYGWSASAFDEPSDIYANALNVYVADKNNNRIQIFDKDLNFISEFNTKKIENENYRFSYPTSVSVSGQGDFYVLDSDNLRILKYNLTGDFVASIGGYDAGNFSLSNPLQAAVSSYDFIYVLNPPDLVIFDRFGNGYSKIPLNRDAENLSISFNNLCLNSPEGIQIFKLTRDSAIPELSDYFEPGLGERIQEAMIFNSRLYVLTPSGIKVYSAINAKK